jgi:hypothetical protein
MCAPITRLGAGYSADFKVMDNRIWDDLRIAGDDVLYRRVPDQPSFITHDLISGKPALHRAAFQWDDDGISVYRRGLVRRFRIRLSSLLRDSSQLLFGIRVDVVRSCRAGVTDSPDELDPIAGRAHASIQCDEGKPTRPRRREIQATLAEGARRVRVRQPES